MSALGQNLALDARWRQQCPDREPARQSCKSHASGLGTCPREVTGALGFIQPHHRAKYVTESVVAMPG